jgi:hypothetical protein
MTKSSVALEIGAERPPAVCETRRSRQRVVLLVFCCAVYS